jgi:hypothetical protein
MFMMGWKMQVGSSAFEPVRGYQCKRLARHVATEFPMIRYMVDLWMANQEGHLALAILFGKVTNRVPWCAPQPRKVWWV